MAVLELSVYVEQVRYYLWYCVKVEVVYYKLLDYSKGPQRFNPLSGSTDGRVVDKTSGG